MYIKRFTAFLFFLLLCVGVSYTQSNSMGLHAEGVPPSSGGVPAKADSTDTLSVQAKCRPHRLHLKTNILGLGMGIANVALEVDIARHWSFSLPVFYSAWNYFKSTIKFRTFSLQPEVRYWPSSDNNGFFAAAHFGWGFYNLALDGDFRYQDHSRETPAIGGGVNIGYRLPFSEDNRWQVEFSVGAGGYALEYDKFHNTSGTKAGLMVESSIRKTYWGVDHASVAFSYSFNLGKKGGRR